MRRDFYPRPPRRGRHRWPHHGDDQRDFYPRPPRRGRQDETFDEYKEKIISTHALRVEGDDEFAQVALDSLQFLPTPSA